jgi:hypothetical protein
MSGILRKQQEVDNIGCAAVDRAFEAARAKGQLSPVWTPYAASHCFLWIVKGLYVDWLRFGMKFDLKAEAEMCLSQLFASFRSAPG